MMNNSAVIPYGGKVFKSKAEFEWARWFDDQGIAWEYETFHIGDPCRHRVDFVFPNHRALAEVKYANTGDSMAVPELAAAACARALAAPITRVNGIYISRRGTMRGALTERERDPRYLTCWALWGYPLSEPAHCGAALYDGSVPVDRTASDHVSRVAVCVWRGRVPLPLLEVREAMDAAGEGLAATVEG